MNVVEFIRQVRDGESLSPESIRAFIDGVAKGEIPDYQASAYLMAVFHRGLSDEAVVETTLAMRDSGKPIDLSDLKAVKVDKHSTGGVGDKISIPLAPWVASCGVPVPMISGRGLGHTGGTLDKLESIPGYDPYPSVDRFAEITRDIGCSVIGQTGALAPADKRF